MTCSITLSYSCNLHRNGSLDIVSVLVFFFVDRVRSNLVASRLNIDVIIIDGFFLLHTMKNVPKTFENISKKLLQMVTQFQASRIDMIFDQYFSLWRRYEMALTYLRRQPR